MIMDTKTKKSDSNVKQPSADSALSASPGSQFVWSKPKHFTEREMHDGTCRNWIREHGLKVGLDGELCLGPEEVVRRWPDNGGHKVEIRYDSNGLYSANNEV